MGSPDVGSADVGSAAAESPGSGKGGPSAPPVIVIGTSDGIGLAIVRALLDEGRRVIGISRRPSPEPHRRLRFDAASTSVEIDDGAPTSPASTSRSGDPERPRKVPDEAGFRATISGRSEDPRASRHEHLVLDVTAAEFPAVIAAMLERDPELATIIHCAGVGSGFDPEDLSGELACFRTNLMSVVELCAVVMPRWARARRGHLVVLSSIADAFVVPDAPSYGASKVGLSRYLRALGLRMRREGVAITNVRFGFVDTKMAQAPVKPFEMTPEKAAAVVIDTLRTRVPVRTRPRRAAVLTVVIEGIQRALLLIGAIVRRPLREGPADS